MLWDSQMGLKKLDTLTDEMEPPNLRMWSSLDDEPIRRLGGRVMVPERREPGAKSDQELSRTEHTDSELQHTVDLMTSKLDAEHISNLILSSRFFLAAGLMATWRRPVLV